MGAIAGGALAEISLRTPFIWQTGIAFIAIPAALTLVEPPVASGKRKPGIMDILKTVRYAIVENKDLRWNLVYSSIIGTATLTMAWVYQLQLNEFGFGEFQIGLTATFLNLLLGFVTLTAYRVERNISPRYLIGFMTLFIAGGFVAAGLSPNALIFLIVLFLFYAARGIATPVLKNYINTLTESDVRATILSIRSLIIRAFFAVIAPFFGWMADIITLNQALIVMGLVFIIVCALTVSLFIKSLERKRYNG